MLKKNQILVVDNFIDIEYQERIKDHLMGKSEINDSQMPWFYIDDVTAAFEDDNQGRPGLSHVYVELDHDDSTSNIISDFHDLFIPLLQYSCHFLNMPTAKILQGRSFMQFPLNLKSEEADTPHIDIDDVEHTVVLYYVCTSDGDTVIYNERIESDTYTEKQRVTPLQGRVVFFDGGLFHTAEQAVNKVRCIANYNLA